MQEDCDEIYPAVLVNIMKGQEAYNNLRNQNTIFQTKTYGPIPQDQNGNMLLLYALQNFNVCMH